MLGVKGWNSGIGYEFELLQSIGTPQISRTGEDLDSSLAALDPTVTPSPKSGELSVSLIPDSAIIQATKTRALELQEMLPDFAGLSPELVAMYLRIGITAVACDSLALIGMQRGLRSRLEMQSSTASVNF